MKQFKIADYWISTLLIIFSIIFAIINTDYFLAGYFITGAWQIISMLVHFANNWFCEKGSARYGYHKMIFIICITLLISFLIGNLFSPALIVTLAGFAILLFTAPFMAVYYTFLCYREVRIRMQRPLAQLK